MTDTTATAMAEAERLARELREHMQAHGLDGAIVRGIYCIPDRVVIEFARGSASVARSREDLERIVRALPDELVREAGIT